MNRRDLIPTCVEDWIRVITQMRKYVVAGVCTNINKGDEICQ